MKLFKRYFWAIAIIFVTLIVGYKLRMVRFNEVPFPGESLDEYSNAWVGLSLIRLGVPVGMSGLAGGYPFYDTRYINVDRVYQGTANGNAMQINYPWFDHPPMMGVITGGYSYLKGARVFEDTTASLVRKPVIWISTVSIALTAVLAWLIFGQEAAVVTAVIMATSPLMIIYGRSVQAENGYSPLLLLSMIFLWLYQKKSKRYLLILAAVVTGVALLFKLSAVSLVLGGLAVLLLGSKKSWSTKIQEGVIFALISLSFFGLFLVYGMTLDSEVFTSVFLGNSNRTYGIGLNAISDLITTAKVVGGKTLADGWPLVGWLGLIFLVGKKLKHQNQLLIWVPLLSYLAVYLFFGSEPYAWYRIPFMPFLIIIAGWLVSLFIKNVKYTLVSMLALLIPLGINLEKFDIFTKSSQTITIWRFGTAALIVTGISALAIKKDNKMKWVIYAVMFLLFAIAVYMNLMRGSMLTVDYWYKVN